MQTTLNRLITQETLSEQEAYDLFIGINEDRFSDAEVSGLMVALQTRNITLDEIAGFKKALVELSIKPDLNPSNAIDLCGTGGDGKNTFNISTTTSFVLGAMGYKVIKHGNYGVSSMCGSSNVLEELGYKFTNDNETLQKSLNDFNLVFLHAPLFHPVMKKVAPIRKSLGIPTFFNIMGPLVNPVQPDFQLTGTFNLSVARMYNNVLKSCRKNYKVVYAMDGYDEISLTGDTRVFAPESDVLFHPNQIGIDKLTPQQLYGGNSSSDSAEMMRSILKGKGSYEQRMVIASNTAHAIQVMDERVTLMDTFQQVNEFLLSGKGEGYMNAFLNQ
jgi:anthranilate phosphoribosyltransferase